MSTKSKKIKERKKKKKDYIAKNQHQYSQKPVKSNKDEIHREAK